MHISEGSAPDARKKPFQFGTLRPALVALGLVLVSASRAFADNPIVQTSYTADPAPVVYDGRLYVYTSHDEDVTVNNFFTMNDWRLYSTVDMVNWTDHGSPAGYKTYSWGTRRTPGRSRGSRETASTTSTPRSTTRPARRSACWSGTIPGARSATRSERR